MHDNKRKAAELIEESYKQALVQYYADLREETQKKKTAKKVDGQTQTGVIALEKSVQLTQREKQDANLSAIKSVKTHRSFAEELSHRSLEQEQPTIS